MDKPESRAVGGREACTISVFRQFGVNVVAAVRLVGLSIVSPFFPAAGI